MRKYLILFFLFVCCVTKAQQANDTIVYRYIIAQPQGYLFSDKCKLKIDDGNVPKRTKDKTIEFKSFAAALMYLTSQGWEMVATYGVTEGSTINGIGSSDTSTYWVLRRPSTKEEVQDIINKSLIAN